MPRPRRSRFPHRLWLLAGLSLAVVWAHSPFTPWAASRAPLWVLYDSLYYARFALGFWWLAEVLRTAFVLADDGRPGARVLARAALLGAIAAVALAGARSHDSGPGLRLLVRASQPALEAAVAARAAQSAELGPDDDRRRRIGAFLVDSRRFPCGIDQPWLWLGRAFGAGTGINLALVRAGDAVPLTPDLDAFRFWPLHGGWWLAYQDGHAYALGRRGAGAAPGAACVAGIAIPSHAEGRAFVASGRAKLEGAGPAEPPGAAP